MRVRTALRFFADHTKLFSVESWSDGLLIQETFLKLKAKRNWSNVTYNTYRKSLLSYFQVLADAGIVPSNPIRRVRKCSEVPTDQPKLGKDQVAPLFEDLGRHPKWMPYLLFRRNRLFSLLAYYTGARPVELLNLTLESFSNDRAVVRII